MKEETKAILINAAATLAATKSNLTNPPMSPALARTSKAGVDLAFDAALRKVTEAFNAMP